MNSTFLDTFFFFESLAKWVNAGIVLGVSQTPECMGLSHPADLIQGHSGPELEQLQLIWDYGSSLNVFFMET